MSEEATLLTAFAAGILSFISPCVLPLVPGYLSFISGISLEEMRASGNPAAPRARATRHVFLASLAFVVGFSLVFVALGATASTLGTFLFQRISLLGKIAGALLILFGLHTMGLLRFGWLYKEARLEARRPVGALGAFVVGLAFAFGWTPCIGPILGSILALAAEEGTLQRGVNLLAVYSLGLGLPFLATSLAIDRFFAAFARIRRHYRTIEVVAGLLMVVVGVLIFTDQFSLISRTLLPYLPTF
jgi:cytochrome c-type biogenesis protein